MTAMPSIRDTFFDECEDLPTALADGLARIEAGVDDAEVLNAVYRAVHSVKGGAGAFGLTELVSFAHRFETVLDAVRAGRLAVEGPVLHVLHRSADHLADLVEAARGAGTVAAGVTAGFVQHLDACLGDDDQGTEDCADFEFAAVPLDFGAGPGAPQGFDICFAPKAGLVANGHDPALLIAALADLGALEVVLDTSALPDWQTMDCALPYLAWSLRLTTPEPEAAVREVFEFVEGLCDLEILPTAAARPDLPDLHQRADLPDIGDRAPCHPSPRSAWQSGRRNPR